MTLDLGPLPEPRRSRVLDVYRREVAAERVRAVFPRMIAHYRQDAAYRETAIEVRRSGFAFVGPRFVRRVVREGR